AVAALLPAEAHVVIVALGVEEDPHAARAGEALGVDAALVGVVPLGVEEDGEALGEASSLGVGRRAVLVVAREVHDRGGPAERRPLGEGRERGVAVVPLAIDEEA